MIDLIVYYHIKSQNKQELFIHRTDKIYNTRVESIGFIP